MDYTHLFRGTTLNWPGHDSLRELNITPTSKIPIIATLFALHCQRFGSAIVQVCKWDDVIPLVGPANLLAEIEEEVAVYVAPTAFTHQFVRWSLSASESAAHLRSLGYELPATISNKLILEKELESAPRLTPKEVWDYLALAGVA